MWHVANWVKGNVLVCMFGLTCSRRLVVLLVVGFVFVCVCAVFVLVLLRRACNEGSAEGRLVVVLVCCWWRCWWW